MSIGTIVLIIVGAIVLLGILALIVWVWSVKKMFKTQEKIHKRIHRDFKSDLWK